ncbi:GNAT family N-acetyltransferase [Rhodococcoides yunnanense]|uniref:GNAT family N-acetyltransferase n=1 Tax=Rhodococcoides yunnanense TaxID=278209 RepID=UPI00353045A6
MIATDAAHRNDGLASALLSEVEARLTQRGVRVWFGRVTDELDAERLRKFYSRPKVSGGPCPATEVRNTQHFPRPQTRLC